MPDRGVQAQRARGRPRWPRWCVGVHAHEPHHDPESRCDPRCRHLSWAGPGPGASPSGSWAGTGTCRAGGRAATTTDVHASPGEQSSPRRSAWQIAWQNGLDASGTARRRPAPKSRHRTVESRRHSAAWATATRVRPSRVQAGCAHRRHRRFLVSPRPSPSLRPTYRASTGTRPSGRPLRARGGGRAPAAMAAMEIRLIAWPRAGRHRRIRRCLVDRPSDAPRSAVASWHRQDDEVLDLPWKPAIERHEQKLPEENPWCSRPNRGRPAEESPGQVCLDGLEQVLL